MSHNRPTPVLARTEARALHLLVRDRALRNALQAALSSHDWSVQHHSRLSDLWTAAHAPGGVAVLDWAVADGLLTEEHRHDLAQLSQRMQLIVLVPEAWLKYLSAEDLGVAALVPKAWAPRALLSALQTVAS